MLTDTLPIKNIHILQELESLKRGTETKRGIVPARLHKCLLTFKKKKKEKAVGHPLRRCQQGHIELHIRLTQYI